MRSRLTRPRFGWSTGSRPSRLLDALRAAHARARERFWELHGAPERLTIDIDATLIGAHSEKEGAAGNYKGGYGFHPLRAYAMRPARRSAGCCGPGTPARTPPSDHKTVLDMALAQIPEEHIERSRSWCAPTAPARRTSSADYCREARMRFSFGYDLTERRPRAILEIPENAWVAALDQDGSERDNGEVAEITDRVDLSSWPEGSQADRPPRAPAPRRAAVVHRPRRLPLPGFPHRSGRPEHRRSSSAATASAPASRTASATTRTPACRKLPFKEFALNEMWLELVLIAHDLLAWTQALLLDGELPRPSPSGCATGCCTSPAGSRSTAAAPGSASKHDWPWATSSPPRSRNSKRSQPPPADPQPAGRPHLQHPPSPTRDRSCPKRPPAAARRLRGTAPGTPPAVKSPIVPVRYDKSADRGHTHAPTERSGLAGRAPPRSPRLRAAVSLHDSAGAALDSRSSPSEALTHDQQVEVRVKPAHRRCSRSAPRLHSPLPVPR